jgi:hypothetical protein
MDAIAVNNDKLISLCRLRQKTEGVERVPKLNAKSKGFEGYAVEEGLISPALVAV